MDPLPTLHLVQNIRFLKFASPLSPQHTHNDKILLEGVHYLSSKAIISPYLPSTIPDAFPKSLNTCGRITVDPSANFVLVSNRGHNSIAVFKVDRASGGLLNNVGLFHTRGRTPRHFQFDPSGKYLIVANQDTDTLTVFLFDRERGHLSFSGHEYDVPSPNFVCAIQPHGMC